MQEGLLQALTPHSSHSTNISGQSLSKFSVQHFWAKGNLHIVLMAKLRLAVGGDLPSWTSGGGKGQAETGPHWPPPKPVPLVSLPRAVAGRFMSIRCLEHKVTGGGPSLLGPKLTQELRP